MKKNRRPQEKKLLVQIASSTFFLLQSQHQNESSDEKLEYYPGLESIVDILLIHLESPPLTSLVLKQIVKSYLHCFIAIEIDAEGKGFASCIDDDADEESSSPQHDTDEHRCSVIKIGMAMFSR